MNNTSPGAVSQPFPADGSLGVEGDPEAEPEDCGNGIDDDRDGPSASEIQDRLAAGNPSIHVGVGNEVGEIYVSPVALEPGEAELVAEALWTVLRG